MREWPYAKEPFDTKLFILLFLKKVWLVVCAALMGTVLIGGGYYLKKVIFGGPTEYEITTTYYIEYNCFDPVTGEMFNYTNDATWKTWVVSDWFVDRTWEYAMEAGLEPADFDVEKSDLKNYFTAALPTDLRIPTSTVTTPYEELTERLNDALQLTYFDFAKERTEMDSIEITNETPLAVADKDVRTLRACILGAVMGAFVAGLGVAFRIIWNDSVVIPEYFTYRYGLPMAGFVSGRKEKLSEEVLANINYIMKSKEQNAIVMIGKNMEEKKLLQLMPAQVFSEVFSAREFNEKTYEKLRQTNGILLVFEAGAHTGKEIEHVLHELQLQDCMVCGALLYNADSRLIDCYRFGRKSL